MKLGEEYVCNLGTTMQKRAAEELGETDAERDAAVTALREWVISQNSWLKSPTDTIFLLGFLRHRKYNLKAAKERLTKYWTVRTEMQSWFFQVDTCDEQMTDSIQRGAYLPLPRRDKDGSRVVLLRLGLILPKSEDITAQMRAIGATIDYMLRDDLNQVCGFKLIQDFTDVSAKLLLKFADGVARKLTRAYIKAYPVRITSAEFHNVGALFDIVFTLVRQFMPKKIQEKTHVHKSLTSLYQEIDMSVLPREYLPDDYTGPHGGTLADIIENHVKEMQKEPTRDYISRHSSGHYSCDVTKRGDTSKRTLWS